MADYIWHALKCSTASLTLKICINCLLSRVLGGVSLGLEGSRGGIDGIYELWGGRMKQKAPESTKFPNLQQCMLANVFEERFFGIFAGLLGFLP